MSMSCRDCRHQTRLSMHGPGPATRREHPPMLDLKSRRGLQSQPWTHSLQGTQQGWMILLSMALKSAGHAMRGLAPSKPPPCQPLQLHLCCCGWDLMRHPTDRVTQQTAPEWDRASIPAADPCCSACRMACSPTPTASRRDMKAVCGWRMPGAFRSQEHERIVQT